MSNGRLAGKVVVITGGTSGIGRASALLFAREGARVVVAGRDEEAGAATVAGIREGGRGEGHFVRTDVTDPRDVERLVAEAADHFGRIDVLYGNAGLLESGTAPETSIEAWQRIIDVNLSGQFYLAKYGIPYLIEAGGGSIIFTGSELGLVGTSNTVAYCAAKGGVINLARAVAVDSARHQIRVNCLCPGPIRTRMLTDWFEASGDPARFEAIQTEPVLLGRIGEPDEIANAALFLASDESSFMTGAVMVVDGGATTWYGM